ncbi:UDP-glucose/GDP-mannose dehydrogenase isoform 1 [Galdieria sulphuraria]|uniref:UDP-glucose/GDP-mannose dehydrogenase isoform 1 n=1 Tax=Galdieria sulphuraria TaxID=130081 RepID=M2Y157_GALSU|nr:UDP-glucose/GDP-mannose dehydrogenase isoform 1 [Galdieria sulphuraria]EME29658.1 UDP-glucose/GDP-mannose dehydrogenase isoform 1 [Galdieria sulphuraria]|eukprot:XP_005706178.1 UDP-glucose/GDP-mannose dehydrogenase isoform 1 [Galdieria sulphuraria]
MSWNGEGRSSKTHQVLNDPKRITLIGVGRLGLCLALVAERAGYKVLGVDVLPQYVEKINDKTLVSSEPFVTEYLKASKNFRATTSVKEALQFADVIMVLVATPSTGGDRHYDVTQVSRVLTDMNNYRIENKHVVICCTVLPGYIATIGRELLKDCKNTSLSYNPEFIAQGDIIRGLERPDIVLIGEGSKEAGDFVETLWSDFTYNEPKICRMSPESAEIAKLSLNCFVTMKISFANQIGDIADRTPNADKYAILAAIGSDTRVGTKCLGWGYGFGGPCFPRDNRALAGYAESVGIHPALAFATDDYNKLHADIMAQELLEEDREEYIFENVTFKEPCAVPIIEESQKLLVARKVAKKGKKVIIRDRPDVIEACRQEFGSLFIYRSKDSPLDSHSSSNHNQKVNPPSSFSTGDVFRDAALATVDRRHGGLLSTSELEKK